MIVNLHENAIVQHVIQIKNGITKHVNVNVKIIVSAKKISRNPSTCISEIKSIADTFVISCDKVIDVMGFV